MSEVIRYQNNETPETMTRNAALALVAFYSALLAACPSIHSHSGPVETDDTNGDGQIGPENCSGSEVFNAKTDQCAVPQDTPCTDDGICEDFIEGGRYNLNGVPDPNGSFDRSYICGELTTSNSKRYCTVNSCNNNCSDICLSPEGPHDTSKERYCGTRY